MKEDRLEKIYVSKNPLPCSTEEQARELVGSLLAEINGQFYEILGLCGELSVKQDEFVPIDAIRVHTSTKQEFIFRAPKINGRLAGKKLRKIA